MELLQRLAPSEVTAMEQRYEILSAIAMKGPIGRRALAAATAAAERAVRYQCDVLRAQGLIEIAQEGMRITDEGQKVLLLLGPMMRSLNGSERMAAQLSRLLRVERVSIQAGDSQSDELRKRELCHAAAQYVTQLLPGIDTMAVMGGTTMALVAQQMPQGTYPQLTVIPARGGLGETLETQANMVAAQMAGRLGSQYRMLHLPDDITADALSQMMQSPAISEVVDMMRRPDILLYSVGRADTLMTRRGIRQKIRQMLQERGAVAEALGMYFDADGGSLLTASAVGPEISRLASIPHTIVVAGGHDKAQAILAAVRATHPTALFMDEAAAVSIMTILQEEKPL